MDPDENPVSPAEIVHDLELDDESARKMAAFRLQSLIADPSFADVFIVSGGMKHLRFLALKSTGNTLAYTLASLSNLLSLDQGWEWINSELVHRLVNLVVGQPLVNILRGAMSVLAAIVQHPQQDSQGGESGFVALKPAIEAYPEFLESLVGRLSSPDHSLCLNALQLLNALMRDAMQNDSASEWPKFIKRLQDLGVIKAVHSLMLDPSVQDLASSLLEFQSLTKILLRKWKDISVDLTVPDHRRSLKSVYLMAHPEKRERPESRDNDEKRMRDPDKWRQLGFQSETPQWEFDEVGYLGMMDLTDFARKADEGFQRLIQEQLSKDPEKRCPIARASIAVTSILYDHFDVDDADTEESQGYGALDPRNNLDKLFRPLMLQWSRLHTSGVHAFVRLWQTTGATHDDFGKIDELVRILVEEVVGFSPRTREMREVEAMLAAYDLQRLRELQMRLLEVTHEESWGRHLRHVRDELHHEALQFIKEQRIRVLLDGAWFPNAPPDAPPFSPADARPASWRFVRLSYNRRYLHYDDFDARTPAGQEPSLEALDFRLDLSVVSSVVSNVTAAPSDDGASDASTLRSPGADQHERQRERARTDIVIHGHAPDAHGRRRSADDDSRKGAETPLLTLRPATQTLAAEWLDGLLLLLNQTPITAETNRLVDFIARYGLRIRLLNVRFEEPAAAVGVLDMPSRDGLDEDYFYDMGGT